MNNPWAYSIIALALVVLVIARGIPRAWLWIGVGGASFIASSLYWDFGNQQLHPIFTFTCDSLVCAALHAKAEEKWELGVFLAFILSVFCSLLKIGLFLQDDILYAMFLETFNAAALLVIGCTGLTELIGRNEDSAFHRVNRYLHSSRDSWS